MKKIYHNKKIEDYIIPFAMILTIVISLAFLIFISKSWALSYVIGSITNIICFKLTIRAVDRILDSKTRSPKKTYIINNCVKLGVYLIVLLIATFSNKYHGDQEIHLEIIPVVISLFQIRLVIYFKYFIFDKIFNVQNFDDSIKGPIFKFDEEGDKDND